MVTIVGCSGQSDGGTVGIIAISISHGTAFRRVGHHRDVVGIDGKVGNVGFRPNYGETIGGFSRNLNAILRPIDKMITCSGGCNQFTCFKVIVRTSACHRTRVFGINRCSYLIAVKLEDSDIGSRLSHGEAVRGVVGDNLIVLQPIDKMVTLVGCGGQCAGCTMIVCASSRYNTAIRRAGQNCDVIGIDSKVGNVCTCLDNGEAVSGICRNRIAILRPIDKMVTRGGCSRQRAGHTIVE